MNSRDFRVVLVMVRSQGVTVVRQDCTAGDIMVVDFVDMDGMVAD